jgi:hypothetical protein
VSPPLEFNAGGSGGSAGTERRAGRIPNSEDIISNSAAGFRIPMIPYLDGATISSDCQ